MFECSSAEDEMTKTHIFSLAAAVVACAATLAVWAGQAQAPAEAAEAKTGVGLAEHAIMAYEQGWKYRYGYYGQIVGGVHCTDCSGLIKSYLWWTGSTSDPNPSLRSVAGSSGSMLSSASVKGTVNPYSAASLPKIQGLILYSPGHVGVYVGANMAVDNRCTGENIKYQTAVGGSYRWEKWFKLPQIQYPTSGFVTFEGHQYYYENGQYVTGVQRTVNSTVYTFDQSGKLISSSATSASCAVSQALGTSEQPLSVGSRGDDVLRLQKRLNELGYITADNCTGYFGPITSASVRAYQQKAGISATGMADIATLESIYGSSAVRV